MAEMTGRAVGRLAVALTVLAHRLGSHVYLSTSCLHGEHDYCQRHTGLSGAKKPARCKFCPAGACVCRCHDAPPRTFDEGVDALTTELDRRPDDEQPA